MIMRNARTYSILGVLILSVAALLYVVGVGYTSHPRLFAINGAHDYELREMVVSNETFIYVDIPLAVSDIGACNILTYFIESNAINLCVLNVLRPIDGKRINQCGPLLIPKIKSGEPIAINLISGQGKKEIGVVDMAGNIIRTRAR
jgi:hypothetical protein